MKRRLSTLGLALVAAVATADEVPVRIAPTDDRIRKLGVWYEQTNGLHTVYTGSELAFRLKGTARIGIESPTPDAHRLAVRRDGILATNWVPGTTPLTLDGGTGTWVQLTLAATRVRAFPRTPPDGPDTCRFRGIALDAQAGLIAPPPLNDAAPRVDFIGDSIVSGDAILGRTADLRDGSDATRTFAYLTANAIGGDCLLRGHPGANMANLSGRLGLIRPGIPLPEASGPAITVLNVGANDRDLTPLQYERAVAGLVTEIRARDPQGFVILLNFFRMTPDRTPILRRLVAKWPDGQVLLHDARGCIEGYADNGVHPDAASHARLAPLLAQRIHVLRAAVQASHE